MISYITKSKLLYKSKVEFEDYAINHITNCTHNCKYPCYARLMSYKTEEEWSKVIYLTQNALEILDKEIPLLRNDIKQVHLCFMSDLFMYEIPEVIKLTLQILKKLSDNKIPYKTLTKGEMPSNKIIEIETSKNYISDGLFDEWSTKDFPINEYGISLVSLDENYRKIYEPNTAPFDKRISSLKQLSEAKLYTYVYCEPFSPLLTSIEKFEELLKSITFINKIYFGSWQYNNKFSDKSQYQLYINIIKEFCSNNHIELKIKKEIAYL